LEYSSATEKRDSNWVGYTESGNDRGPFVKGRIIDLSGSAFSSIANIDDGVINVKIEVIK
jgi:expansin (peptidoglycan-binding protein)